MDTAWIEAKQHSTWGQISKKPKEQSHGTWGEQCRRVESGLEVYSPTWRMAAAKSGDLLVLTTLPTPGPLCFPLVSASVPECLTSAQVQILILF